MNFLLYKFFLNFDDVKFKFLGKDFISMAIKNKNKFIQKIKIKNM